MRVSLSLCSAVLLCLGCNDYRLEVLDTGDGGARGTADASSLNRIAPSEESSVYAGDETFRYLKLVLLSTLRDDSESVEISEVRYSLGRLQYPETIPLNPADRASSNLSSASPERAFDGADSFFRTLPSELPATLTLDMSSPLPAPDKLTIVSNGGDHAEPGSFELRASMNGENWVVLGNFEGWVDWHEPDDEYDWEREERSFAIPPSSEWRTLR